MFSPCWLLALLPLIQGKESGLEWLEREKIGSQSSVSVPEASWLSRSRTIGFSLGNPSGGCSRDDYLEIQNRGNTISKKENRGPSKLPKLSIRQNRYPL
jgi:hypothetical protein